MAWLVLLLAAVGANLPFVTRYRFLGVRRQLPKTFALHCLELLVLYFIVGAVALAMEHHLGQIATQGWQFYALTAALFTTLAFPGFALRYLFGRQRA